MKTLRPDANICINSASTHNLKNVSVAIPQKKLVVVTGVSGSGKTSLAFDTLYAEGHRRYVESFSSYARLFLGRLEKPPVKSITGLAPCISVSQNAVNFGPLANVGSLTEISDYLRLLYTKLGRIYSPVTNEEVKRHTPKDILEYLYDLQPCPKSVLITFPLDAKASYTLKEFLALALNEGSRRLYYKGKVHRIEDIIASEHPLDLREVFIIVDNIVLTQDVRAFKSRILSSVRLAFQRGGGYCFIVADHTAKSFSEHFDENGVQYESPKEVLFNFNSPYAACKTCGGFGKTLTISEDIIIPNKKLSVIAGAVSIWRTPAMSKYLKKFIPYAQARNFPLTIPYEDLSEAQKAFLWGDPDPNQEQGALNLHDFFRHLESRRDKIQNRVLLFRLKEKVLCPTCRGARLRAEALYVKINGFSIDHLFKMSVEDLQAFIRQLNFPSEEEQVLAKDICTELLKILNYLIDLGLSYLTINREASTLSGGELQRLRLATTLANPLVGSIYVLDEPSIGLHAADVHKLVKILKKLRDMGNTVVVVEHEELIMQAADCIIDMGPRAGINGGHVVFSGTYSEILAAEESLTGCYLRGALQARTSPQPLTSKDIIKFSALTKHNIQSLDIQIPLNALTVVSGPSGSGKTTLIKELCFTKLSSFLKSAHSEDLSGDYKRIEAIELIDQTTMTKMSRSNPATYIKVYDDIRKLFAAQPASRAAGLNVSSFSFNTDGGRCPICKGEGRIRIDMQFMADILVPCEDCKGQRFTNKVLEIQYKNRNIYDILNMSVDEALPFFQEFKGICNKLKCLQDVGLGYIKLGQESSSISGGEAQRVKLASFLTKADNHKHTVFIFDEPTIGLHFEDVKRLMLSIRALIAKGNTVIIIEHDLDVIASADWVIDLGPEGGLKGGKLLFQGELAQFLRAPVSSATLSALKEKLK